jgi:hypothetical protein
MGAAPSLPPPSFVAAPADNDEVPALRAKALGKVRLASRRKAREHSATSLRQSAVGVSNGELGEQIGGELAGAQAHTGALVLTAGEVAMLLPIRVGVAHLLSLIRDRICVEMMADDVSAERVRRLHLAVTHLKAIDVVLAV